MSTHFGNLILSLENIKSTFEINHNNDNNNLILRLWRKLDEIYSNLI